MRYYNTLTPYDTVEYDGIEYSVCTEYGHISRYRQLRQVIHNPNTTSDRFTAPETANPFETNIEVEYYKVPNSRVNRLDLIAAEKLGDASYAWIIAYLNKLEDGYSVQEGQKIAIPKSISQLFNTGEILASISPLQLNLGTE